MADALPNVFESTESRARVTGNGGIPGASPDEPASIKISVRRDILADSYVLECEMVHIELYSDIDGRPKSLRRDARRRRPANCLCWDVLVKQGNKTLGQPVGLNLRTVDRDVAMSFLGNVFTERLGSFEIDD